jgi:nucleotide-binding universal stress UspA family protein
VLVEERAMKILVPVDYSEHSRTVLNFALTLAPPLAGPVTVAHVWETQPQVPERMEVTMPDGTTRKLAELIREEAERAMADFMRTVQVPAGVSVAQCLLSGSPAASIVREAVRGHVDLIVIGTQGRTAAGRLVLGSVAEQVIRTSPIPVLAVPVPEARARAQ